MHAVYLNLNLTFTWQICYGSQNMFGNSTIILNSFCNSRAKIACLSTELIFRFLYLSSNIQNASEQFVSPPPFFRRLRYLTNPRNKNLRELGPEIQTALFRETCGIRDTWIYISLSHKERCHHLPNYWPFLLNHPVWSFRNISVHNKRNFAYVYQQDKPECIWFLKPFTFPDSDSIT